MMGLFAHILIGVFIAVSLLIGGCGKSNPPFQPPPPAVPAQPVVPRPPIVPAPLPPKPEVPRPTPPPEPLPPPPPPVPPPPSGPSWEGFDLEVLQAERLTPENVKALKSLLLSVPRQLYRTLRIIGVDMDVQVIERTRCAPGELCAINVLSDQPGFEDAFPADGPREGAPSGYSIMAHELTHQIHHTARTHRGMQPWIDALIAEAGVPAIHYLRNIPHFGIGDGFFLKAPQEFVASIGNQWFTSSKGAIRLALDRFANGANPHPLNSILLFTALFNPAGDVPGSCLIFEYTNGECHPATMEMRGVIPGPLRFVGPDFNFSIELTNTHRVSAVWDRTGV